jgi:hypothetical protein
MISKAQNSTLRIKEWTDTLFISQVVHQLIDHQACHGQED